MRLRRAWIIPAIGLLLGCPVPADAGNPVSFSASVDRTRIGVHDRLTLTFLLENAGLGGGSDFRPPDLGAFYVLSGPNRSSSIQLINGSLSSSVSYTYLLQPRTEGKITIGPARVAVDGRQYATRAITIEVRPGGTAPGAAGGGTASGGGDRADEIARNLFLRASIDREHVMQGEPIDVTFRIYTRLSVTDYVIPRAPAFTGFWSVEIPVEDTGTTTEEVDGKRYRAGVVKHVALFPNRPGDLVIPPLEIETVVQLPRRRSRDPFDAFFRDSFFGDPFGRSVKHVLRSDPIPVRVDPLPSGAPPGFRGAVGTYRMKVGADRTEVTVGEPVTLRVEIEGTGNIELLEAPDIEIPAGFERYPPRVSKDVRTVGGEVSGSKTFEFLLVPRAPGGQTVASIRYPYFDLDLGRYVTLESKPIEIAVDPAGPAGGGRAIVRGDVELLTEDIRFIRLGDPGLRRSGRLLPGRAAAAIALLLPLAGFAAVLYRDQRERRAREDRTGHRRRRAPAEVRKRFRKVREALRGRDPEAFHAELAGAVRTYVCDSIGIDPGEFSVDRMAAALGERGISAERCEALAGILRTCARASYAPGGADPDAMERLFDSAKRAVSDLEREL